MRAGRRRGRQLRAGTGARLTGRAAAVSSPALPRCPTPTPLRRPAALSNARPAALRARSYAPAPNELVLGVVRERHTENYDVDIRGPCRALLPVLAFEGATKRNRPQLQVWCAALAHWCRRRRSRPARQLPRAGPWPWPWLRPQPWPGALVVSCVAHPRPHSAPPWLLAARGCGALPRGKRQPRHGAHAQLHGLGGQGALGWRLGAAAKRGRAGGG